MEEKRISPSTNQKIHLFAEVDGVCPNCPKILMYDKKGKKYKQFEIAHIYPLNPTKIELELLKKEEKLSSDPNSLDNLICLCVECHTKFDKPRTVEEYQDLVSKKKKIIHKNKAKSIWNDTKLEDEIFEIISLLSSEEFDFDSDDILNYNPKKIDRKTNNTITALTKRNIHRNVQDYYSLIKNKFKELDKIAPLSTETISSQIRTHYLALSRQDPNQSQKNIFDGMVSWVTIQTNQISNEASEIVVSYFIQNCEIFE